MSEAPELLNATRNDCAYALSDDLDQRPVTIVGAGTLGRRIATVYAAGGSDVRIFDTSSGQRNAARRYVQEHALSVQRVLGLDPGRSGTVETCEDLATALSAAWMAIESVPERVELKTEVFGELDRLAEPDALLCSNSSSFPSRLMVGKVSDPRRVLNTHYQQPPEKHAVELMSCGQTDDAVIPALMEKLTQYGLEPFWVRRESVGFIFNRIWAAIKRECLMVVDEGVARPEDIDALWQIFTAPRIPPFRMMDRIGLDVVLDIEEHYAKVRPDLPEGPRTLLRAYIEHGRLGAKAGRGFYDDVGGSHP